MTGISVFHQYFGHLAAPHSLYDKRLRNYCDRFEHHFSYFSEAIGDPYHPLYFIMDFMLLARENLMYDNPVTTNELRETCANIRDGYIDRLDEINEAKFYAHPDYAVIGMRPDAKRHRFDEGAGDSEHFKALCATKPSLSDKYCANMWSEREDGLYKYSQTLTTQTAYFVEWMQVSSSFFEAYHYLRLHHVNSGKPYRPTPTHAIALTRLAYDG